MGRKGATSTEPNWRKVARIATSPFQVSPQAREERSGHKERRTRCQQNNVYIRDSEVNWQHCERTCGPQGARGEEGGTGKPGCSGPQGSSGSDGLQGLDGSIGFQGRVGEHGPQGLEGILGVQGYMGLSGPPGTSGNGGPQGVVGVIGPQGLIADTGPQGVAGPSGTFAGVFTDGSLLGDGTPDRPLSVRTQLALDGALARFLSPTPPPPVASVPRPVRCPDRRGTAPRTRRCLRAGPTARSSTTCPSLVEKASYPTARPDPPPG